MASPTYDIVTVGGGLGGAAFGGVMAARGARVLVLERDEHFSDRVRGEVLMSWGVAELENLGLHAALEVRCAHALRWLDLYYLGALVNHRDLVETTPQRSPWISFYHPEMQQIVLDEAGRRGAEVRRGVRVRGVRRGAPAEVTVEGAHGVEQIETRLVVGADGRGSLVRKWAGFDSRRAAARHRFTGLLFDGHGASDEASRIFFDSPNGRVSLLFPQGQGRVRAYVGLHAAGVPPPAGGYTPESFLEHSVAAGVPREWYEGARSAGPLATFDATDNWVEHPYREGVALLGDAAATSDPTWGQGMSLTLRDARTLADALLAQDDWDAAGHAYAREHDRYAAVVRTADDWFADLFIAPGPAAEARRERALPLLAADPTRLVDVPSSGPDLPIDESARRRMFGEE